MIGSPSDPAAVAALVADLVSDRLGDVVEELKGIRLALERLAAGAATAVPAARPAVDLRHTAVVTALADALGDFEGLPFDAAEVLDDAERHDGLAEALEAARIENTADLGLLFRSLRDRPVGGYRLKRDGRTWRLERCTSYT